MSAGNGSLKAIIFALGGNLLIAVIKTIVAIITASTAMLAEAIHSFADCSNQIFLLISNKRSAKGPTEQHPFGYGKEEYFWGFMVAILLFFVGAIFSIYEGVHKLFAPSEINHVYWSFSVLIVAIIIESKSLHVAYTEFKKNNKGVNFVTALKESTDTNLFVILIEDFAALTGLIFVLVSTLLAWLVNPIFDAVGSIFVGLILVTVSIFLTNELRKLIIGENIPRNIRNKLKAKVAENIIIKHVNSINAMVIGRSRFLLIVSVDIKNHVLAGEIEVQLNEIRKNLITISPEILFVYIDVRDINKSYY